MEAVTGLAFTPEEVTRVGERINNLARAFNVRKVQKGRRHPPERLMTEPLQSGSSKGQLISREDLNKMLDEYYTVRGWDLGTGVPTRKKLKELNLDYVCDEIGAK